MLFFTSLLLRDICQMELKREDWLWFTRRPIFYAMVRDVIRACVQLQDNKAWLRFDPFVEPREAGTLGQVTESARACSYYSIKQVQKHMLIFMAVNVSAVKFWLLTCLYECFKHLLVYLRVFWSFCISG